MKQQYLAASVAALACLLGASACASSPQDEAAQLAEGSQPEKVCKRIEVIGSIMPKKVCSTQQEWDALDRAGRENMEEIDRQIRSGGNGSGVPLN